MSEHEFRPTKSNRRLGTAVTALAAGGLAVGGIAVASSAHAAEGFQITKSITTTNANTAKAAQAHPDTYKIQEAWSECASALQQEIKITTASSVITTAGDVYTVTYVFNCVPV